MTYVSMNDHEDADGNVDWSAYKKAQVENGESCYICGAHILLGAKGYRRSCADCDGLRSGKGESSHERHIRCPHCRYTFSVHDSENYELYQEGEHETYCPSCDQAFEVSVSVTYTFTSPQVISDDGPADDS